jgi:hypothetical protein
MLRRARYERLVTTLKSFDVHQWRQRGHSTQRLGKPATWGRATPGEGPQSTALANVKAVNTVRCGQKETRVSSPLLGSPCAVKVARTVTTGGMERRAARYRALSLPTEGVGNSSEPLRGVWRESAWSSYSARGKAAYRGKDHTGRGGQSSHPLTTPRKASRRVKSR